MNKSDLKYGNVVELRNKAVYLYNLTGVPLLSFNGEEGHDISQYKKDLTFINNTYPELDIMKVYNDYTLKELLWERKEPIKLSNDEKVILKNISKEYKWIAKDKSGYLILYKELYNGMSTKLFNHLFQSIKWEDEEPYFIEDLLKGE